MALRTTCLIAFLFSISCALHAQLPAPISLSLEYSSSDLDSTAHGIQQRDTLRNFFYDEAASRMAANVFVKESGLVITLYTNPYLEAGKQCNFLATAGITVNYRTISDPSVILTQELELSINSSIAANTTVRANDAIVIDDVIWADVAVHSVTTSNGATITDLQNDLFYVKAEILGTQSMVMPITAEAPSPVNAYLSDNGGYVKVVWNALAWATAYDVEWTFVDAYQQPSGMPLSLPYQFTKNCGRITVREPNYELPLIYDQGMLIVRVRAHGVTQNGDEVFGRWSRDDAGTIPFNEVAALSIIGNDIIYVRNTLEFEGGRMPWQHTTKFSADGLRNDNVQFHDGLLYSRQNINKTNSNGNYLIVDETIYDHVGRPAIAILPTPHKPDPLSEKITDPKGVFTTGSTWNSNTYTLSPSGISLPIGVIFNDNPGSTPIPPAPPSISEIPGVFVPTPSANFSFLLSTPWILPDDFFAPPADLGSGTIPGIPEWTDLYIYSTSSPAIRYQPGFNVNTAGQPYSRMDFDLDTPDSDCSAAISPAPLGTQSGAGRYYSPFNPTAEMYRDLIPDAKGYPFQQKVYTSDPGSMVSMQGDAGADLMIGSGHEQVFSQATPTQKELDQLFGNDAGNARYYKKFVVTDQNGQNTINYADGSGHTIATALSGTTPEGLTSIEHATTAQRADLILENLRTENLGAVKLAERAVVIVEDNATLTLNYQITPQHAEANLCEGHTICDDCVYDLHLAVFGPCGNIYNKSVRVGTFDEIMSCGTISNVNIDTTIQVDAGTYYITYALSPNTEHVNSIVQAALATSAFCEPDALFDPVPCVSEVCNACSYDFIDDNYIRKTGNTPGCARACSSDKINGVFDRLTYEALLRDMSPGGQYGQIFAIDDEGIERIAALTFPVSVFNVDNQLSLLDDGIVKSYRTPAFSYRDPDGSIAWVDVTSLPPTAYRSAGVVIRDGKKMAMPQDVYDLRFLNEVWKDSWSESLVSYHPEYAYYLWNKEHAASYTFDTLIRNTTNFDEALSNDLITQDGGPVTAEFLSRDPFFDTEAKKSIMLDLMNHPTAGLDMHVYQLIRSAILCNTPYYESAADDVYADCYGNGSLADLQDDQKQFAWEMFRGMYQSAKSVVIDRIRTSEIADAEKNNCIGYLTYGCPECADEEMLTLFGNKSRHFQHADCMDERLPIVDVDGDGIISEVEEDFSETGMLTDLAAGYVAGTCSADPRTRDWLNFFDALAFTGKLSGNVMLPTAPPLMITSDMAAGFAFPLTPSYQYSGTISGTALTATIKDPVTFAIIASVKLQMETPGITWSEIAKCICITCEESGFYLQAITKENESVRIKLSDLQHVNIQPCPINDPNNVYDPQKCCFPVFPNLIPAPGCEKTNQWLADANKARYLESQYALLADSLTRNIIEQCMSAAESFVVTWNEPVYYYTLFYYDRAGNLISSIPPEGVDVINNNATLSAIAAYRAGTTTEPMYPSHGLPENATVAMATVYHYNSFNQTTSSQSPDAGLQLVRYDKVARPVLTQSAVLKQEGSYHCTLFDDLGRIVENGIYSGGGMSVAANEIIPGSGIIDYGDMRDRITHAIKREVYYTKYDEATEASVQSMFTGGGQKLLAGRVASVAYDRNGTGEPEHIIYMSYDIRGNIKEFVQDNKEIVNQWPGVPGISDLARKHVSYDYDVLTGAVTQVAYQEGSSDQFYHWYQYDADGKMTTVQTGTHRYESPELREINANFKYYLHGPLARAEIGLEKVQGVDFSYTINGWLKNINSISALPTNDPGYDGNVLSAVDAYALSLQYFENDYSAIGRNELPAIQPTIGESTHPLFNKLVQTAISRNEGIENAPVIAQAYKYDQLGRIVSSETLLPNAVDFVAGEPGMDPIITSPFTGGRLDPVRDITWTDNGANWKTTATYDNNGNINSLTRADNTGSEFDDLEYHYISNKNQLAYIQDNSSAIGAATIDDLKSQSSNNYAYDANGRLIADASEDNAHMTWDARDKLTNYSSNNISVDYYYDASGRRVAQKTNDLNGEVIVRDLKGNILSTYDIKDGNIYWANVPIYANTRMGGINLNAPYIQVDTMPAHVAHYIKERGITRYELTNQTGDIAMLISDRKIPVTTGDVTAWYPDMISSSDYYPFGMVMPGRHMRVDDQYDFGFHGMAVDHVLKGEGNSIYTEFRQYDPRVGRWLSVDPSAQSYPHLSPYVAFVNNPITVTDALGNDPPPEMLNSINRMVLDFARSRQRSLEWQQYPSWQSAATALLPGHAGDVAEGVEIMQEWVSASGQFRDRGRMSDFIQNPSSPTTVPQALLDLVIDHFQEGFEDAVDFAGFGVEGFTGNALTVVNMMTSAFVSLRNNVEQFHSYLGNVYGYHYQLALLASRVESLQGTTSIVTLMHDSDLELNSPTDMRLFGQNDEYLSQGWTNGALALRQDLLNFEQKPGGREAIVQMLRHYNEMGGGNVESIQRYIYNHTGIRAVTDAVADEYDDSSSPNPTR